MNTRTMLAAACLLIGGAGAAYAQYNPAPAVDLAACRGYANAKYQGGADASPIAGQTKDVAFCTCMWNETPDNFKGNLAAFADTAAGAALNKTCEKYSNWSD